MLKVLINGIPYKASTDYEISEKAGNKTSSKITVLVEEQPIPAAGDIIEVEDAETGEKIFYGACGIPSSPTYTCLNEPKVYSLVCGNGNSILDNRIANIAVQDKTISEIAHLLFEKYIATEGITLGYISDIPTALAVYTAGNYNLREVLNELANLVNAVWEITPSKVFNFFIRDDFPVFRNTFSRQFLLGAELQHKTRNYNLRTVQIVAGATDTTNPQTEGFVYDSEQKNFETVFPVASKPVIWVNGTEVPPDKVGISGFEDTSGNITFLFSPNAPGIGYVEKTKFLQAGDVVTVQYIGIFSIRAVVSNSEKISEIAAKTGTSGIIEHVHLAHNVRSTPDAVALGLSLLSQFEEKEGEITFWLTSEQLQELDMGLKDTALLTLFNFDLPEIGITGQFVVSERKILPFSLVGQNQSYRIILKLADRNLLRSYAQILRDLERDIAQISIREDELVITSELIKEMATLGEQYALGTDIAYYAGGGICEGSRAVPLDFGLVIYAA